MENISRKQDELSGNIFNLRQDDGEPYERRATLISSDD